MSRLRQGLARVGAYVRRESLDERLEDELKAHLAEATDDYLDRGFAPAEARRLALVSLGGLQQARERQREARGVMTLDTLLQDLRYTFRKLINDPAFSIVSVLILALGIGANVAVFSVVNTLMLRPLPFANPQQLVWIAPPPQKCGQSCATYSTDAYDEFRAYTRSYQDVTGYFAFSGPGNLNLQLDGGAPIPATSIDVIANFFQVLGVQPAMGRSFTADDARDGAPPVILLSNPWWKRQFNADPKIVGKAFDINGHQTTVIGVLPASFDFGAVFAPGTKVDAITPLDLYGPPRGWGNIITMIGRLKPGVTLGQAVGDSAQARSHMCWNNRQPRTCGTSYDPPTPVPLKEYVSGRLHRPLIVLWSAVGMILLIACVNLSNLLLARAAGRSKEFAMRGALGASRGRIVRQLLTESIVLSCAGALVGLLFAVILVDWFAHQGAVALPLLSELRIDGAALGWTVLIAAFAAILFGLVPGLRMGGGNLHESLKDSGPGTGVGRRHERLRSVLVIGEVALACMLLVGAGLLLRSFLKVLDIDLGFSPDHAASIKVDYEDNPADGSGNTPASQKAILARRQAHFEELLAKISAIPGVEAAGVSDYLPLGQNRSWGTPFPKGVKPPDKIPAGPLVYVVTPGYLGAMGTGLRGRDFRWNDGPDKPQVVIISKAYAQFLANYAHWPNGDAVGQILDGGGNLLVIGVADNVHTESVEGDTGWQIYYPSTQTFAIGWELVIRSRVPPSSLAGSVFSTLQSINPKQSKAEFKPIRTLVDHAVSPRRFFMLLVASFAGLGLVLAALGIYGVISYSVTQRTQEIGIRMALGSTTGRVQGEVLARTLRLAVWGVVLGTVASVAIARLIASLLFGTSPWDMVTYAAMAACLLSIAVLSGYLPARRASRISPMVALRAN